MINVGFFVNWAPAHQYGLMAILFSVSFIKTTTQRVRMLK